MFSFNQTIQLKETMYSRKELNHTGAHTYTSEPQTNIPKHILTRTNIHPQTGTYIQAQAHTHKQTNTRTNKHTQA